MRDVRGVGPDGASVEMAAEMRRRWRRGRFDTSLQQIPSSSEGGGPSICGMSPTTTIDFVSDVICPWCFIGLQRLEAAITESGGPASVTFRPFLLDPTIPMGGVDLRERVARKFGGDPEVMFARVEAAARESGIPLDYSKIRRTPNTLLAHTLLRHAEDKGTQRKLGRALFEAYFLEGRDIGDETVLAELAQGHGFSAEESSSLLRDEGAFEATRKEAEALSHQGIRGVPFIVFGGTHAVSGAQPIAIFREALERARREHA